MTIPFKRDKDSCPPSAAKSGQPRSIAFFSCKTYESVALFVIVLLFEIPASAQQVNLANAPGGIPFGGATPFFTSGFGNASVENQYFWYSFWMTIWAVLASTAYAKRCIDQRREQDLTDEMMTDLYNHDLYSRQAARDAIAKYNQHIEQCNRMIEAAESGRPIPGSRSAIEELSEKLRDMTAKLDAANQEKDKLQTELDAKRHITTNLSTRVEARERNLCSLILQE